MAHRRDAQAKEAGIVPAQLPFDSRKIKKIRMDNFRQLRMNDPAGLSIADQHGFHLRML